MHREALTHQQKRWRRRVFAITWLAYAGFYLCRKNFAVVMPLLAEDLGYSKMDFATVIFSYSLLYALGQFGNGLLSDRFGARLVVGVGLTLSILSNLFMGIAVSLALFTVLACVNGVGQSSGWPGLVKTMAHWFGRRERGVVMGWWGTNYVLGGSFATVFATFWVVHPWLFLDWGWRRGFWLPAWLLAIVTLLFVRLVRNRPHCRQVGTKSDPCVGAIGIVAFTNLLDHARAKFLVA
ncbi:MAG: MFS transporter [Acidobacteriota bacterium]